MATNQVPDDNANRLDCPLELTTRRIRPRTLQCCSL